MEPIAVYTLTPRVDDLASLMALEGAGFRPRATVLVLNGGRVDDGIGHEQAFARMLRHSAFRGAVQRGGVPVWMPKMDPVVALEIEAAVDKGGLRNDVLRYPLGAISMALGVFPEPVAQLDAVAKRVQPAPQPPGQEVVWTRSSGP